MSAEEEDFIVHPEVRKKLEDLIEQRGITDYVLSIEPGSVKGDNYLGVIAKVRVNARNATLNWIVKSAPQLESYRKFLNLQTVYGREIYMYEKVFPLFRKFEVEKKVAEPFGTTAPVHMTCLDEFRECLVLEDMKALGYRMKDRKQPLDFDHVRLVMRAYGKFHAISYALKERRPDVMAALARETDENFFSALNQQHLRSHAKNICDKALNSLDPVEHGRAVEVFGKYCEQSFDLLLEAIDLSRRDPYSVVTHGDSWVNNMLFKYSDDTNRGPVEVCLLDFQLAKYGSPAFDLSYFIFACTDKALRDENYDEMISTYYDALGSHLVNLGGDPRKLLPFHVLQAQLERYSVYGLYMSTMVLNIMLCEADELPDLTKPMTDEEIGQSFVVESKNDVVYYERVGGVIVDFVEKGYLDFVK